LHDAGTITTAEQGDFIEIRLNEPPSGGTWRLSNRLGDARLEAEGADRVVQKETGPIRIFRFRALGVGRSELSFTLFAPESAAPVRELKFMFAVR